MNKLIAFGDSFTWGSELSDVIDVSAPQHKWSQYSQSGFTQYSQKTWAAMLSKYLKMKYVCYAKPGISNNTIFRILLENLDNISADNDLVVLNWTWIDRWDFFDTSNDAWETILPKSNSEFSKIYLKHIQSELWDKLESLKVIALTHEILKDNNIEFISTCVDGLLIDKKFHCPKYIDELQNTISKDMVWFDEMGFTEWAKHNTFDIGKDGHPLEESHSEAFDYIKKNYDFTK